MKRLLAYLIMLATVALATPAFAETPKLGEVLTWPSLKTWLEDPPVPADAAGKVVVHWFCSAKAPLCKDDLARLIALREAGKIYVIGYINGSKRDAGKLDPVRSAIGGGAVSYGAAVGKLMKTMGLGAGPSAIVVGTDGRVAHVQLGGEPDQLDQRDTKVNELVAGIKEFRVRSDGPTTVKVGERFEFKVTIELASWLSFNPQAPTEVELSLPTELKCDAAKLTGDKIKIDNRRMTAAVGCSSSAKGSFEARADYRFGYQSPSGAQALGSDGVRWKFEVQPQAATR